MFSVARPPQRIHNQSSGRPSTHDTTVPHIFFSDASTIHRVSYWNVIMNRWLQPKE
jgi:hypothetical protein